MPGDPDSVLTVMLSPGTTLLPTIDNSVNASALTAPPQASVASMDDWPCTDVMASSTLM